MRIRRTLTENLCRKPQEQVKAKFQIQVETSQGFSSLDKLLNLDPMAIKDELEI